MATLIENCWLGRDDDEVKFEIKLLLLLFEVNKENRESWVLTEGVLVFFVKKGIWVASVFKYIKKNYHFNNSLQS